MPYTKVCICSPTLWKVKLPNLSTASCIAWDILIHHIWGPRRRTWGIEMTVINSMMRDVSRHSSLADIVSGLNSQ